MRIGIVIAFRKTADIFQLTRFGFKSTNLTEEPVVRRAKRGFRARIAAVTVGLGVLGGLLVAANKVVEHATSLLANTKSLSCSLRLNVSWCSHEKTCRDEANWPLGRWVTKGVSVAFDPTNSETFADGIDFDTTGEGAWVSSEPVKGHPDKFTLDHPIDSRSTKVVITLNSTRTGDNYVAKVDATISPDGCSMDAVSYNVIEPNPIPLVVNTISCWNFAKKCPDIPAEYRAPAAKEPKLIHSLDYLEGDWVIKGSKNIGDWVNFHEYFGRYNARFSLSNETLPMWWATIVPFSYRNDIVDGKEIKLRSTDDLECFYSIVPVDDDSGDAQEMTWKRLYGGVKCPSLVGFNRIKPKGPTVSEPSQTRLEP